MNQGIVLEIANSGKTGIILRVGNPDNSAMPNFIPGQYTALGLESEGVESTRAYSICSLPGEPFWEFLITVVQGGKVSSSLAKLRPGDTIFYKPTPKGNLILQRSKDYKNLIFVATGSGIGPFRPMSYQFVSDDDFREKKLIVLQGARFFSDLHYREWFEETASKGGFDYITYTSREHSSSRFGRVTDWFKNAELDPSATAVYLCGNPDMVYEIKEILVSKGFDSSKGGNIITESYW